MRRHHLREMVPSWIDNVLTEWALWMRSDDSDLGYPRESAGFRLGGGGLKEFQDLEDQVDGWRVQVADSIIDGLECPQRIALHHVYLYAVFSSVRWSVEEKFADALSSFGDAARKRGLT